MSDARLQGMRLISGGVFLMGSDSHYPEERPARRVRVDTFHIDETPVTNAQFALFVTESGYQSFAERAPDPALYPGILPEMIQPGSLLFTPPAGKVDLNDISRWWQFCFGADWKQPYGPGSSLEGLSDHPVVHISYEDAQAYAAWAGKSLPTEAEWEYAARGGLDGADYAWGDELSPGGATHANYWQGLFPWQNTLEDGYLRTSPVRTYPANGFGLYDMIGNVWEWTEDWYVEHAPDTKRTGACCIPVNPRGGSEMASFDPCQPEIAIGRKVLKGGSHLCAESYCLRYRPAARYPQPVDTSTSHVGFRCVVRGL
jgi:formylglycine-generating enzyme